jgi:type II secretion system protein N
MASFLANLGPRARKALRYLGFALLAVVSFVLALQLTIPVDRVKDRVIDLLASQGDVTIGEVERGIMPGRLYFKAFTFRFRPSKAGEVATTFYMDQLEVDVGLLALLRGAVSVGFDAKIGQGHFKGRIARAADGDVSVHAAGDDLPSASLPVRELGLPMSGKVRLAVNLELPMEKAKTGGKVGPNWTKAEAGIELACPAGCTIGDGKSKLKLTTRDVRQQAFLDEGGGGIDFGKVNIDSLFAEVELKSGKLEITRFDAKSGDGDLKVAFSMQLNPDLGSSTVAGCLRFRGSDALLKREPKTHAAISTTGAPLGPDNLFHIKLEGQVRAIRRIGVVCSGPGATSGTTNPNIPPPRPNLSVNPEAPAGKPPGLGTVTLPVNPPAQPVPMTPAQPPPPVAPPIGSSAGAQPPAPVGSASPGVGDSPHAPGAVGEGPPPVVFPSNGSAGVPGAGPPQPPPPPPGGGSPQ